MPPGARDAHHHIAQFAGRGIGNAGAHDHLFQSQAFGRGRQPAHDVVQFIAVEIERRPDIQQDAVPIEPLTGWPPRLKQADAGDRLGQHALQMRQLHDAAGRVPHRCYVTNFRAGKQPLIFGVVAGDGMEQVDVFHRRQALNIEIAEPPQMQALGHHRMDSAIELFLLVWFSRWADR